MPEQPRQITPVEVLGDEWLVQYVIEVQDGASVITGARVTPIADKSRSWPPKPGTAPSGGLTARTLRAIRTGPELIYNKTQPGLDLEAVRRDFAERSKQAGSKLRIRSNRELIPPPMPLPRRPGSSGRPEVFYVDIAARYVKAVDDGSRRPVADVAKQLGYSHQYVRDLLNGARERGLLTRPPRGRAGGQLTDEARRLLEDASAERPGS